MLAWRIKKTQAETTIHSIKSKTGNITIDPTEINDNFRVLHTYKSEYNANVEAQNMFLDQTLSEEDKAILYNSLTIKDILEAIGDMNSGKAP